MPSAFQVLQYRGKRDADAVYGLIRRELVPLSRNQVRREDVTDRALHARLRKGRTFIALGGRSAAVDGFVHLMIKDVPVDAQPQGSRLLQIDMLAVRRDRQGRRLGTRLLEEAERYGRNRRCTAAMLFVDEGNERAVRFYARAGYQTVRYLPDYRCYELRKPLIAYPAHPEFRNSGRSAHVYE